MVTNKLLSASRQNVIDVVRQSPCHDVTFYDVRVNGVVIDFFTALYRANIAAYGALCLAGQLGYDCVLRPLSEEEDCKPAARTLVSFHARKNGYAGRQEIDVVAEGQTFRDLCLWIDSNTSVNLFPCSEDGSYWEDFGDAEAYKDESGRIVARDLDRATGVVDIDGEYNSYYVRDLETEPLTQAEVKAIMDAKFIAFNERVWEIINADD